MSQIESAIGIQFDRPLSNSPSEKGDSIFGIGSDAMILLDEDGDGIDLYVGIEGRRIIIGPGYWIDEEIYDDQGKNLDIFDVAGGVGTVSFPESAPIEQIISYVKRTLVKMKQNFPTVKKIVNGEADSDAEIKSPSKNEEILTRLQQPKNNPDFN